MFVVAMICTHTLQLKIFQPSVRSYCRNVCIKVHIHALTVLQGVGSGKYKSGYFMCVASCQVIIMSCLMLSMYMATSQAATNTSNRVLG